jgi:hypothetical protein
MTSVNISQTTNTVVVLDDNTVVVQVEGLGPQGPQGPPGTPAVISPMSITQQVIAENYTVTAGYNGLSAGDVDVAATYAVTVLAGATWVIV